MLSTSAADKALAELHKALKADAKDTRALLRLAELQAKSSQHAIACETYARAADVFVAQGFARRALSAFAQGLEVARKHGLVDRVAPIARAMAKLYAGEKLPLEAISTLDGAVRVLVEKGADADAAKLLEERVALDDSEIARVRLAEALFRLGDADGATTQLEAVFTRLHAAGRRDEALEIAERLLGQRCDVAIARASAELYLARNRPGDPFLALAKLRVACSRDATHLPTLDLLARAFEKAGHGDKATRVRAEIDALSGRGRGAKKAADDSMARAVDLGWDEIAPPAAPRLDPSRASFWAVEEGPPSDVSGSVVSVSVAEVELVDPARPASDVRAVSLFDTALECIDALVGQGRNDEALALIARHLDLRPRNALLLERKAEILEEMTRASLDEDAVVVDLRLNEPSVTGVHVHAVNS